jgi:ABC-type sugar transport system ATPase subunit
MSGELHDTRREAGEQGRSLLPEPGQRDTGGEGPAPGTVVSLRRISKSYPGVRALSSVDLDLVPGQVHAVVGENGAGKSTLLKIVAGMATPDSGTVYIDGRPESIESTGAARARGISAVPQELSLVSHLSVAENICVTALPARRGIVSRRTLRRRSQEVLERLGLNIDPFSPLGEHGPGVQELVMIGRGLVQDARVLVLDEPTASLTAPEIDHLFEVIKVAKAHGVAFLYVSHRLQELARIAETITVLRDGERVVTGPAEGFDHDQIVRAMVGRAVEAFGRAGTERRGSAGRAPNDDPPRLRVEGLARRGVFEDVSFSIGRGEIVGLAGLIGAGRTEVARAIFGVDRLDAGSIEVDGQPVTIRTPRDAVRTGIAMVPEERKSQALVLGMSVEANLTVSHLRALSRGGWLQRRRARQAAQQQVEQLDVRTPSTDVAVGGLSGGNQQKVVIGRWLLSSHRVYLFDEPTRGVDIGAKFAIYDILRKIRDSGAGLLVISSELLELMNICDRILVMREGRLVNELQMDDSVTEEQILRSAIRPHAAA